MKTRASPALDDVAAEGESIDNDLLAPGCSPTKSANTAEPRPLFGVSTVNAAGHFVTHHQSPDGGAEASRIDQSLGKSPCAALNQGDYTPATEASSSPILTLKFDESGHASLTHQDSPGTATINNPIEVALNAAVDEPIPKAPMLSSPGPENSQTPPESKWGTLPVNAYDSLNATGKTTVFHDVRPPSESKQHEGYMEDVYRGYPC